MGRPSASRDQKRQLAGTLRVELQKHIERGQCAYCRAPARPNRPLTREHVIPRARGGRRNDVRIIVPACARCNHHRGCQDLIPFLLRRPERISSFLDYLGTLTPESIRELDLRIFAELYVAVAILNECSARGPRWRAEMDRLCNGRALHRRRYAARRAVGALSDRLSATRPRDAAVGPTCLLPDPRPVPLPVVLEEPLERLASRLISAMALVWHVSAEVVEREMTRELAGSAIGSDPLVGPPTPGMEGDEGAAGDEVLAIDGWHRRPKRKRLRVDRRQGRAMRQRRAA